MLFQVIKYFITGNHNKNVLISVHSRFSKAINYNSITPPSLLWLLFCDGTNVFPLKAKWMSSVTTTLLKSFLSLTEIRCQLWNVNFWIMLDTLLLMASKQDSCIKELQQCTQFCLSCVPLMVRANHNFQYKGGVLCDKCYLSDAWLLLNWSGDTKAPVAHCF